MPFGLILSEWLSLLSVITNRLGFFYGVNQMPNGLTTNRFKKNILNVFFLDATEPTSFTVRLVSDTPDEDTNNISELTEITGSNYSAVTLSRNSTDFDVITEDDANDAGYIELADVVFTGAFSGATHCVLCDNSGDVLAYWPLQTGGAAVTVSANQTYTLQNGTIKAVDA